MAVPRGWLLVASALLDASRTVTSQQVAIRGVSYGPVPLLSSEGATEVPADDWFCDESSPMWGPAGRGDLKTISQLGANMVRLYGNNPDFDHTSFLDEAWAQGLSVAPGMSDFPFFQQVPGSCLRDTDFNCFSQVKPLYAKNLQRGFLLPTSKSYHPALKYMNVLNEPDLKMPPNAIVGGRDEVYRMCRAIVSAFDAMLDAEREAGVSGRLVNFTATFSFAICTACEFFPSKPALAQMAQLDDAMRHPEKYGYTPRNELLTAYESRFTHSFNTANPAQDVKSLFLDAYEQAFPRTPVYIGEYHRVGVNQTEDLEQVLRFAETNPLFLGISYFQFQVAYWKLGSERDFGIFGLSNQELVSMPYLSKTYQVHCLQPVEFTKTGMSLSDALTQAYGGVGVDVARLCRASALGVNLTQVGFAEIAKQHDTQQMAQFVERVIHHMGAFVKERRSLHNLAGRYSSLVDPQGFAQIAGYIGSRPDWMEFDDKAECVADRSAPPGVVGAAITWACAQGTVDCGAIPLQCTDSTYRTGDYVFSRFFKSLGDQSSPLVSCSFEGAAIFAPSGVYKRWTGVELCLLGATTATQTTSSITTVSTSSTITTTRTVATTSTLAYDMPPTSSFLFSAAASLFMLGPVWRLVVLVCLLQTSVAILR